MSAREGFLFLVVVAACGARTPLEADDDASIGAPSADGGGVGDAIAAACGTWRAIGPPVLVSTEPQVPGDVALASAAAVDDQGVVVAWQTAGDLMRPTTIVARRVSFDAATLGGANVVFRPGSVVTSLDDVAVAGGFGHAAIVAWDGNAGCGFQSIDAMGAPSGPTVNTDNRRCGGLDATRAGFDIRLFGPGNTTSPTQLSTVPLTVGGAESTLGATLVAAPPGASLGSEARATLDDATFVFAVFVSDANGKRLLARHFDANGAALAAMATVADGASVADAFDVALAPARGGLVAAWTTLDATGRHVVLAVLDRDGRPTRAPLQAVNAGAPVTALSLAATPGGDVLLAWTEFAETESSAWARSFSADGAALAQPISLTTSLANAQLGPNVRIVVSGARALGVIEARVAGGSHRVYAVPLVCGG